MLDDGQLKNEQKSRVRVHMIADDKLMSQLSVATKTVPNAGLILQLKEAGRAAADTFLAGHIDDIGKRSTIDLKEMFS